MVLQPTGYEGKKYGFITVLSHYKDDLYYGKQKYFGICIGGIKDFDLGTYDRAWGIEDTNPYLSYDDNTTELYSASGIKILIDTDTHKELVNNYCHAYITDGAWTAFMRKSEDNLKLAQVILGVPQFMDISFKNGNTLDLRKENMVVC